MASDQRGSWQRLSPVRPWVHILGELQKANQVKVEERSQAKVAFEDQGSEARVMTCGEEQPLSAGK